MPILTEQRKRQKNLITVTSIVIIVTLAILYSGRLRNTLPESTPQGEGSGVSQGAPEIRLNLNLLEEKMFKELIPYDRLPRDITTGRNNPFTPYSASEPAYIREQMEQKERESFATSTLEQSTSTIP